MGWPPELTTPFNSKCQPAALAALICQLRWRWPLEAVRTVEVGLGSVDGKEGDEVGRGKIVTTLVDVETETTCLYAGGIVAEEGVGDSQREIPCGGRRKKS